MYIISLEYVKDMEAVEMVFDEHIQYVEKYFKSGHFICSGRKVPRTGGVILARAGSQEEIERIAKEDPYHLYGVSKFTITQFMPTRAVEELNPIKNY